MNINIKKTGDEIAVTSPYNPEFAARAKRLGGRWNPSAKTWDFDARNEAHVRAALIAVYGSDGSLVETVTLRAVAKGDLSASARPIMLCGRVVVSASGRDSGARLGEGVVLISGRANSGGSVKNWTTKLTQGAVIEMQDVPRTFAEEAVTDGERDFECEIVGVSALDPCAEHCVAIAQIVTQIAAALETKSDELDEELGARALNELAETRRQLEALLAAL